MKPTTALSAVALLALAACLENEEEIEVRPDGSVEVTLRASGNLSDISHGHPLALRAPWEPLDDETRLWMREVGAATGGPAVRARVDAGAWTPYLPPDKDEVRLTARAAFASVEELPAFLAPASEPYRTALLERSASLDVARKGGRTVYSLERVYRGRPFWPLLGDEWVPEDVRATLEAKQRLTADQVARVHGLLLDSIQGPRSMRIVTSTLAAVYTEGEATLSTAAYERTLGRIEQTVADVLTLERIRALFDAVHYAAHHEGAELPDDVDLEELLRAALRTTLVSSLAEEGLDPEVLNAVRERLEWNLTSYDLAKDLEDETFVVRVTMPGVVVTGNYDALEGRTAVWEFEGKALFGADRRMSVVSVLE